MASLTVTGTAGSKNAVARYVEALGAEPVFADPYLTNAAETDGQVQFTVQVNVTPTALGGRFTSKTSKPGGN